MQNIPELPHNCNSWVIVRKGTIEGVAELWDIENVKKINFDKYEALITLDYLQKLNKKIKLDS